MVSRCHKFGLVLSQAVDMTDIVRTSHSAPRSPHLAVSPFDHRPLDHGTLEHRSGGTFEGMSEQLAVTVRPATPGDAEDIARIWYDAWADGHRDHVPEALLRHRGRDQFSSRAAQRVPHSWVGEVDGRPVGFVSVEDDELEQIFVDSGARGTGLAARLLEVGEAAIHDAGHRRAWLAVVAGNARARAFYEKHGWHDAGSFAYEAQTGDGPIPVSCRRYEIDLAERS